ncbi:TPA: hypothetical protein N6U51_004434 [Escherichia coli]|nr:hypothetical protein [Escherichia coli]
MKKNGAEIYNRTALDNTLIYSGVIDMPAGHGHMTLEFSVSAWLVNDWYCCKRRCTRTYCGYWCSYALGCDWLTWTHHHR